LIAPFACALFRANWENSVPSSSTAKIDGIYAVFLSALDGQGALLCVLMKEKVTGVDFEGVFVDGSYEFDASGNIFKLSVLIKAPPNVTLVQGVLTGPSGIEYEVKANLPLNFSEIDHVPISTPLGPLNARFKKLRSI
jgi:hypothetical protein